MRKDHTRLICDVSELTGIFHESPSMEGFLQKITAMVTDHMACEVCSVYLYFEDKQELVLTATKGLSPSSIGQVRMKMGEGLTGMALKERRAICEGAAKDNPNFRYFPGIGEEQYESFLAVPILRGSVEIGVMVIQSVKRNYFTPEDIQIFRAITSQLAATIETARLLIRLNEQKDQQIIPEVVKPVCDIKFVKGRSGAEGVVLAQAYVLKETFTDMDKFTKSERVFTKLDLVEALQETEKQLQEMQNKIESSLFDVAGLIFTAQLMMIKDKGFIDAIIKRMDQGVDVVSSIISIVEDYVRKFEAIADSYLRDKIYDVKDVGRRLLENLTGLTEDHDLEGRVVIARELFPSDTLKLYSQQAKGIVLLTGGVTGHVAILARSLNMPLVVVNESALLNVSAQTMILVDGVMGYVYVDPDHEVITKTFSREDLNKDIEHLKQLIRPESTTKDGIKINLMANINLLGDLKAANEFQAQGIGLYRSEFPFLIRSNFPSEEEQYLIYRRLVEGMKGKPIVIRTLDIGGDKVVSYDGYTKEDNPFLGLRSIRFSLKHKDVFIQQIRAILRAGFGADVRILFPMISSVDEFLEAKGIVQECIYDLSMAKIQHLQTPLMGAMIELPSVLEVIDDLSSEVDFFSIGTNDLIQYLLAVDRTNDKVADMYVAHHPSVLRALAKVVQAAKRHNKDISICGDMAHDQRYIPFLLGIGLRSFSMDASYLPKVSQLLANISLTQAQQFASQALRQHKIARTAALFNQ